MHDFDPWLNYTGVNSVIFKSNCTFSNRSSVHLLHLSFGGSSWLLTNNREWQFHTAISTSDWLRASFTNQCWSLRKFQGSVALYFGFLNIIWRI